ncbi:MAG: hypothetical protein GX445_05240 [Elusimicrobia bacterium]|nr:hypothetical protein [Elusimicrobiota bacterium]
MNEEEEKKDEKKAAVPKDSLTKKVFKYNILLLLLFFVVAGVSSYFLLSREATKLAGGRINNLESSFSKAGRFSLIKRIKYLLTNDESVLDEKKVNRAAVDIAEDFYGDEATDTSIGSSSKSGGSNSKSKNGGGKPFSPNDRLGASLASVNMSGSGGSSTSISKSGSSANSKYGVSKFNDNNKTEVEINEENRAKYNKLMSKKTASASESLKNSYVASLSGAKDVSNDTARAWTSKAFESVGGMNKNIKYNDNANTALDKIDPNSIPAYLKDQEIDPKYNSLKPSSVPEPGATKDDQATKDEKQNTEKMAQDMASGAIQSAAGGETGSGTDRNKPNQSDQYVENLGLSQLYSNKDDYGDYTVYKDNNGFIFLKVANDKSGPNGTGLPDGAFQVFDPKTNQISFCSIPGQGILNPGQGSCAPADTTWQWDEGYEGFANFVPAAQN